MDARRPDRRRCRRRRRNSSHERRSVLGAAEEVNDRWRRAEGVVLRREGTSELRHRREGIKTSTELLFMHRREVSRDAPGRHIRLNDRSIFVSDVTSLTQALSLKSSSWLHTYLSRNINVTYFRVCSIHASYINCFASVHNNDNSTSRFNITAFCKFRN
jgi:hypothetical protein